LRKKIYLKIPEQFRMNEWHDFFIACAGASAALMGLIFVGVSINLTRILSFPTLPGRALISMMPGFCWWRLIAEHRTGG
jgi:hypothetical protein